jgi:hypothetical protein
MLIKKKQGKIYMFKYEANGEKIDINYTFPNSSGNIILNKKHSKLFYKENTSDNLLTVLEPTYQSSDSEEMLIKNDIIKEEKIINEEMIDTI